MRTLSNTLIGCFLILILGSVVQADNGWIILSGTVWLDANGNGQIDADELPLSNWTLQADHLYQTRTNTEGTYSLTVPAGSEHRLLALWPQGWQQTSPMRTMEYRYGGTQVLSPTQNGSAEVEAVAADSQGNHYLAGYFSGTVDFDPGAGEDLQSSQSGHAFLTRVNMDQSYAWTLILPSVGYSPTDITVTADQNILLVGKKSSSQGYVALINSQGTQLWIDKFTNAFPYGVCTAPDRSLYVTGDFKNSVDFDPNEDTENTQEATSWFGDLFLLHLTESGEFGWVKTVGGGINSKVHGKRICTDSVGNIYLAGYLNSGGDIDFDPGPEEALYHTKADFDSFVCQYDPNGSYVWTFKLYSSYTNQPFDMKIDALDRIIVVGGYNGRTELVTGEVVAEYDPGAAGAFAMQLDPNGSLIWLEALNESSVGIDMSHYDAAATGVCIDSLDNVHVVGERVPDDELLRYEEFYGGQNDLFIWNLTETGESQSFECFKELSETPSQGSQGYYVPLTWDVAVDAFGDLIVGGRFSQTVDLAPGDPQDIFTPRGQTDAFALTLERLHGTYLIDASSGSQTGLDFGFLPQDPNATGPADPNVTEPNNPPIDVVPI